MGLKVKKGTRGPATQYMTRNAALKKLQLSLADFRKLCILKGIFPRDPKRKKNKSATYYHAKDVLFLQHEPILNGLRRLKIYRRKMRRAVTRGEKAVAKSLVKQKPVYSLYHIVKQRYPTFLDAVKDLDDALSTVALFASLPCDDRKGVHSGVIAESTRLLDEFMYYSATAGLVRHVFCSIKGYYIQLRCLNQQVMMLIPHQFSQELPADVDFRILLSFLEFYHALLKSINFKLFKMEGLSYPPEVNKRMVEGGCRFLALQSKDLSASDAVDSMKAKPGNAATKSEIAQRIKSSLETAALEENGRDASDEDNTTLEETQAPTAENEVDNEEPAEPTDFTEDDSWKQLKQASEQEEKVKRLFGGCVFFLSREVPRVVVSFLLKSCGAQVVGWQGDFSPIKETDTSITHHVLDRPLPASLSQQAALQYSREFVQPQWVFDSINSACHLPVGPYKPGEVPPPHMSPFDSASTPPGDNAGPSTLFAADESKVQLGQVQSQGDATASGDAEGELEDDDEDDHESANENGDENDDPLCNIEGVLDEQDMAPSKLLLSSPKLDDAKMKEAVASKEKPRRLTAEEKREQKRSKASVEEKERRIASMSKRKRKLYTNIMAAREK